MSDPGGPARLTRLAVADLRAAARWAGWDDPAVGRALGRAVAEAATLIGRHPQAAPLRPDLSGGRLRVLTLRRLPYLVIYDPDRRPPVILRVVHAARDAAFLLGGPPDQAP